MNVLLARHGLDLDRVITVGPRDHRLLAQLYHCSDLGLFPNRLEGGNNMVLMEYLACGKPAVVSYNSGHVDVVHRKNAILIETHRPMERYFGAELVAIWNDPSLEETIEKLEWCYQNRDALTPLGRRAATDMKGFSWECLAQSLLDLTLPKEKTKRANLPCQTNPRMEILA
jgi:glycosyltransferase involved in cell wall biosynthesis